MTLALFAALATPARAGPTSVSARVRRVRKLYKQLYFDEAMKICQAALDAGRNRRDELLQLLALKGVVAASQGKPKLAVSTFRKLLVIDPLAKIGRHAPRIRRAFRKAKRWAKRHEALTVEVMGSERAKRRGVVFVSMTVNSDPLKLVKGAVLYARAKGAPGFKAHPIEGKGPYRWKLRLAGLPGIGQASRVEYYAAALDNDSSEMALAGTPRVPLAVALTGALDPPAPVSPVAPVAPVPVAEKKRASTPWFKAWWFWTAVGAAVVGAGVGIGVAVGTRSPSSVDGSVTLEVTK